MSIYFWKALGSLNLNTFATLLKVFDGHMFQPHGIITALLIELGGKIVFVYVEVVDTPLEYNLLLENNWFYDITIVVSSFISVLCFPHQGKIITIDHIPFCLIYLGSNVTSNIPFVDDTQQYFMNIGTGIFKGPSLMGIFPLPPPYPIAHIASIKRFRHLPYYFKYQADGRKEGSILHH